MTTYNFSVIPPVSPIDQGQASLCWCASTAVMFSWEDNQNPPVSMQDAANRLGVEFIAKYAAGAALLYSDLALWTQRAGFTSEGQQCIDADGWNRLLQQHGPLIALIDGDASSTIDHAVVVSGINGDGSADGTFLIIANSDGGIMQTYSLNAFATVFELPNGTDQLFSVAYKL